MTYDYDEFGNVIYKHSLGDITNSSDDIFEFYKYVNNTNAWIVNKISNYSLFDSDNATMLRSSLSYYDGAVLGASPTKGDVTKKEELLLGGTNKINLYRYNSFGNLINATDSNGKVTNYGYGTREGTNTFPDNSTNAKNQTVSYFYDLGTGNLISELDTNMLSKNYTYDNLAVEKTTILPFDTLTLPTQEYSYDFTTVDEGKIIVKQREKNGTSNTLDTYKFYDGFGRLIQTKTESPNSKQIVVDSYYDEFGRIKEQSNPYFVTFSENYSTPNTTVSRTKFTYDILDRIIKVTNPDFTFKNISYNHWNVTTIDENSNRKDYSLDAYSRIIQVVEFNASESYKTKYAYNGADELIEITDALNNTFNYTYDSLGRKIKDKDPDRGLWNYTYDSEGNLIKQFDNRNISLSFTYDSLNRKLNETSNGTTIKYVYDKFLNFTLSDVVTNISITNYTYDNRLRKTREDKNISSKKYSETWTYDSADRVTSQIMPDGRVINFTYDEQGLMSNITSIITVIYGENNNPVNISYINNLITQYNYNSSNFRLNEIKTFNKQKLNYRYDSVGNVIFINDSVHAVNYTMSYDALNRLTNTALSGSFNALFSFVYDQIGNIRNVTGTYATDYYYQDTRPHATCRVVFY